MKKINKRIKIIVIICVVFFVFFIFFCPLMWIDFEDFDKYKFTEAYYNFIASSVQLLLFGILVSYFVERNHNKQEQKQIQSLLQKQKDCKDLILKHFQNNKKENVVVALCEFRANSTLLESIDRKEKAELTRLNYEANVKGEMEYIINNINIIELNDNKIPAIMAVTDFLNNYSIERE